MEVSRRGVAGRITPVGATLAGGLCLSVFK